MGDVASVDVGHVILAIEGVSDCAVVGFPHERETETVTSTPAKGVQA